MTVWDLKNLLVKKYGHILRVPIDLAFMVNHLPPQAYSKETLIQAYNWLRHQPSAVQEMAKTPDVLVSLFSKAQMHGDSYLNRAHIQNFKTDLKSLANMMGEFDSTSLESEQVVDVDSLKQGPVVNLQSSQAKIESSFMQAKDEQPVQSKTGLGTQFQQVQQQLEKQRQQQEKQQQEEQLLEQQKQMQMQQQIQQQLEQQQRLQQLQQQQGQMSPAVISQQQMLTPGLNSPSQPSLDMRSISMIQEVKNQFNLSSESEALRLLISIGYQKIRTDL